MIVSGLKRIYSVAAAILVAVGLASAAQAEKRVALVIGNSAYTEISPLTNPRNDAELMTATLRELDFEVVTALDANRTDMGRAIRKFSRALRSAGEDAVGLFFYAGHGVQAHGGNFLIPIGAAIETDADLEIEAVNTSYIMRQLEGAGNRLNLVVLDACRNNPFKGRFRDATRGLQRIQAASGAMIAFSAGPGQAALDGKDENSPYTKALVAAMKVEGLKVEEVFKRVRVAVEKDTGGAQTPWEESSLRGEFYFRPPSEKAPIEVRVEPIEKQEQNVTTTTTRPGTPGRDTWTAIQSTRSKAILRTFIEEYPDTIYAKFAKARLAELELEDERRRKQQQQTQNVQDENKRQNELEELRAKLAKERDEKERIREEAARELAEEKERLEREARERNDREQQRLASLKQEDDDRTQPGETNQDNEPIADLPLQIQRALRHVGCNPGQPDGKWGRKSTAALERFARWGGFTLPGDHVSHETLMMVLKANRQICTDIDPNTKVERDPSLVDGNRYGSISYSMKTDAHGWSYDFESQDIAESRAVDECAKYGEGCIVAVWFSNACGALAVGDGYSYGADWGRNQQEAENKALNRCNSTTSNCKIRRALCTTR